MEGVLLVVAVVIALAGVAVAAYERRASTRARRASTALDRSAQNLREQVQALDEERRAMNAVLSSMEEGIVLVGPDGKVHLANAAAGSHLGTVPAVLAGVLPLGLQQAIRRTAAERRGEAVEVETGAPSRWLRGATIPVSDDGSVLLVLRDVTASKRLEHIRRDFVANASHELKTPAASIRATAETIRTAADDDPSVIPRFAEQLDREAVRLSRIVSDLLDLSRLETGSALDEQVSLDAVLREEGERVQGEAAEAGVELSIRAGPAPKIRGSARDLSLLVRNLVDNAIRYTKPGGRVDVRLDAGDGEVVLTVTDTGVGIPTRDLPRIFERFYRVDRARSRETGGTGLGLSIVKHVVENHGGSVGVTSELGRGTTFLVRLPAASAA